METSKIPEIKYLPFFCDLPEGARGYLQSRLREFHFPSNQLIIEEGKHGNFLGVVGYGLVDLEKSDGQIQTLLPGEMFGEQMLLFKQPSNHTVRARSESSLWVITRSDMLQALQIGAPESGTRVRVRKKKIPYWFVGFLVLILFSVLFLSPELPLWTNQLVVRSLLTTGQSDLAGKYLIKGIQYNPASAELRESIGYLHYLQGDYAEAQVSYSEAVKLDGSVASAWNNLGAIALINGKPADSLPAMLKAVELDPGSPEALFNLGSAYFGLGELENAADSFRRAAELKPGYEAAKVQLAAVLTRQWKLEEARMVWEEILYWAPEHVIARFGRGMIAVLEDRPAESIPDLEAALLADPADPYAHLYLGLALQSLEHPEEARAEFKTVIGLSQDPELLDLVNYHLSTLNEEPY